MEPLVEWIFTHVLIALAPILFKIAIIITSKIKLNKWYQVIQNGELYIFSTTLSASSIVLPILHGQDLNPLQRVFILALMLNLLFSTALFAMAGYLQLTASELENVLELKIYTSASVACSIIAISLSYYISGTR